VILLELFQRVGHFLLSQNIAGRGLKIDQEMIREGKDYEPQQTVTTSVVNRTITQNTPSVHTVWPWVMSAMFAGSATRGGVAHVTTASAL
jgi:hypothetical protein